jgi:hypothetical protein
MLYKTAHSYTDPPPSTKNADKLTKRMLDVQWRDLEYKADQSIPWLVGSIVCVVLEHRQFDQDIRIGKSSLLINLKQCYAWRKT